MFIDFLIPVILCSAAAVSAAPFGGQKRSGVTPAPTSVETSYTPYEYFAAAVYCTNGGTWAACGGTLFVYSLSAPSHRCIGLPQLHALPILPSSSTQLEVMVTPRLTATSDGPRR
ncbi:hypothetical protein FRB95_013325 [Tulasnella sp. JGI-2019a]|nr:hypothetical protein FRB95_013325 [Tulasnella sp. JGI-2019a]